MLKYNFANVATLVFCAAAAAQSDHTRPATQAEWVEESPGKTVHFQTRIAVAEGDARFEGSPVTGAPYSAEAVTQVVQTLSDGNKIRRENKTLIQRDSNGRTRREETLHSVGPWSTDGAHKVIFINDPVAKVQYILDPDRKAGRKIASPKIENLAFGWAGATAEAPAAELMIHPAPGLPPPPADGTVAIQRDVVVARSSPDAVGTARRDSQGMPPPPREEDLGKRMIEGLECVGTRLTTVLEAEKFGADRDIEIMFERWTSPELGVDVLTERRDPRSGVTTYSLKNISRVEPLPSAFEPPADYEIATDEFIHVEREFYDDHKKKR